MKLRYVVEEKEEEEEYPSSVSTEYTMYSVYRRKLTINDITLYRSHALYWI